MAERTRLPRMPLVDAARGVGIVMMVVYHAAWDLSWFGYLEADVGADPGWKLFAWITAGLFLLLVGVGLVLASEGGLDRRRWLRRLAQVAAGAALISLATRLMFPDGWIFFGILHHIAVASVLGLGFVALPWPVTLAAAVLAFTLPWLVSMPLFDRAPLQWLGLGTYVPASNDYVPLFPWFGCVLGGIVLGRGLLRQRGLRALASAPREGRAWRWLRVAGRHSLVIYLLHQPLLYGAVAGLDRFWPASRLAGEEALMQRCVASCTGAGGSAGACELRCACARDTLAPLALWRPVMTGRLPAADHERVREALANCPAGR